MAVEELQTTVRFRVTFPKVAYARMEVLAEKLAMDVPTFVRFATSLQLVQWEATYNTGVIGQLAGFLSTDMAERAEELFPETDKKV